MLRNIIKNGTITPVTKDLYFCKILRLGKTRVKVLEVAVGNPMEMEVVSKSVSDFVKEYYNTEVYNAADSELLISISREVYKLTLELSAARDNEQLSDSIYNKLLKLENQLKRITQ